MKLLRKFIRLFKTPREEFTLSSPDDQEVTRDQWGSRAEFLLSCIGLSVGIGNIWRFPYLAYKNGGAAFLIPYTILLILVGKPIYFLEIALGQFSSLSFVAVWRCCPIAKGIGMAMQFVCVIVCIYYNVLVSYTVFYTAASFAAEVPWKECYESWGPNEACYVRKAGALPPCSQSIANVTPGVTCEEFEVARQTASEQYWTRYVLHMHESDGIGDLGEIRWQLVLCLIFSWFVVFICLIKGIKSSGKVVYFTATFPYVVLLILMIRGVTLDGAVVGLKYLFIPDWNKLLDVNVWKDAAEQMFFSLSTSWGTLIMFGSYNRFRNKVHVDAFIVSMTDFATSLMGCIAVFSILGYLAQELNLDIASVATKGPGLAFIVYPEAIALLPLSQIWSVLFFVMLFTLGLDSEFAMLEGIVSNIYDKWPKSRQHKALITLLTCVICFLLGLPCVTNGGQYVFQLMDSFGASQSILVIALFEMICLMWIYGVRRIIRDFEFMLQTKLSVFWLISWGFICPVFLLTIFILSIIYYEPITYDDYNYPNWALGVGWALELVSLIQIPIWAAIAVFRYWRKGDVLGVFRPTNDWGPADALLRRDWKEQRENVKKGIDNLGLSQSTTSISNQKY